MQAADFDREFTQAQALYAQGRLAEAEQIWRGLLQTSPQHGGVLDQLCLLLAESGRYSEAAETMARLCRLRPQNWGYHANLGRALAACGDLAGAEAAWQRALQLKPDALWLRFQLAGLYLQAGEAALAETALKEVLDLDPEHAMAHNNLAALLKGRGQDEDALSHFAAAHRLRPAAREPLLNLAQQQKSMGLAAQARASYERLLATEPGNPVLRLCRANVCESVAAGNEALFAYRRELEACLDQLLSEGRPILPEAAELAGCAPPAELCYQGLDELPLKQKYARLFEPMLSAWAQLAPPAAHAGRQRIGFVVTAGHERVFIRCLGGILQRLSTQEMALVIVCGPESARIIHQALHRPELSYLALAGRFAEAVEILRAARFDLLYYWECGTDALNYFLPFCRLARVQLTGWAWPVTSGIPNMDYFLSMAGIEPEDAEAHYSERLIRLPHLPTRCPRPSRPDPLRPLADFGLPADRPLYFCNQNPLKVHPDFDRLVAEILRQDSEGLMVFTGHRQAAINEALYRRWSISHPDLAPRIRIMPLLAESDYLSLVSQAGVILDTLHYTGGANTNLDAFACGTPVVTLPGRFHRGRYTAAAYRQMGLSAWIAADEADYVRRAVATATRPERRLQLSRELQAAASSLFDDERPVAELEHCLLNLCHARTGDKHV